MKTAYQDIGSDGPQRNTPALRSQLLKQVNSEVSSGWSQLSDEAKNAFAGNSSAPVSAKKPKSHRRTVIKKALDIYHNLV